MQNPRPISKAVNVRPLQPGDASFVAQVLTAGVYACGRSGDVRDATRAACSGATGSLSVITRGTTPAGVLAVRATGRLTPTLHVSVIVGAADDADDAVGAATRRVAAALRAQTAAGWLTADAPAGDSRAVDRMRSSGWTETMTVRGGLRRYVMVINRGTGNDECKETRDGR